jgi:hypothetical protein
MRVTIEHGEKTKGFLNVKKFSTVSVQVLFSEEEKLLIESQDMINYILVERAPSAEVAVYETDDLAKFYLRISHLFAGEAEVWCARTIRDAKEYQELVTNNLGNLKSYLTDTTEIEEKTTTFEL